jgi:hypothetical protein
MSLYLSRLIDPERRADCAANDEAERRFDTDLHRVQHDPCRNCPYRQTGEGEGRDCECCREASEAALRGLWTTVRNTVRAMNTGDWLAVLALICALGAYWSH